MHKLRVTRTPLVAVLALLALFVVPAAAQAHHVETEAACVLENNVPTVQLTAYFVGFSSTHNVSGKVNVDNTERFSGSVPVQWGYQAGKPNDGRWTFKYATTPGTHTVQADFAWPGENAGEDPKTKYTKTCPTPKTPDIKVEKDGPSTAYVGDTVKFTFKVTNTGNVALTNPVVTDDKCAPVTKVPNGQNQFDPGDVWNYECSMQITDAMGDELINTVKACGKYGNTEVCDEDDHKTKIPKPAIDLDKTGATTAVAGSTFTYSFVATNIGTVSLTNVQLTDNKCQSTLTRVEPNLADATFDPGDKWYFTCTVVAPAGPAQVDNIAKVCGDYVAKDVPMKTVCDEDTHTFTVPPPSTPPENPPTTPPSSTPDTPPAGGGEVLPESIVSGRAQLRGPSGCVKKAFRARVRGRAIRSVTFYVDGRRVKKVNRGGKFTLKVRPARYGLGRHKVVALVRFRAESGTKARKLPLTFRRCAQGAVAPRFTG
jgi:hypothetical protein